MRRQLRLEFRRTPRVKPHAMVWIAPLATSLVALLASCSGTSGGGPSTGGGSSTGGASATGGGASATATTVTVGAGGQASTSSSAVTSASVTTTSVASTSVTSSTGAGGGESGDSGPPDPGPTGCVAGQYLLCEDFEKANVGEIPGGWSKDSGGATVASDEAFAGMHSLKVTPSGYNHRIHTSASVLPSAHWGRIFFKVQKPVPTYFVHSTLVSLDGIGPKNGSSGYRVVDTVKDANGTLQWLYNVQPNTGPAEFGKGSPYNWKFDEAWHCAEWHIEGPTQSYHFYLDSAEITQIAINNGAGNYSGTDIPSSFSQINIGWSNYQQPPNNYPSTDAKEFTAWLDNFAADKDRIGCK